MMYIMIFKRSFLSFYNFFFLIRNIRGRLLTILIFLDRINTEICLGEKTLTKSRRKSLETIIVNNKNQATG